MITIRALRPGVDVRDVVGFIPSFLHTGMEESAKEQFNKHYMGGWNKLDGFELNKKTMELTYTGDPPYKPLALIEFRDERIYVYAHSWVCIVQPNGEWEAARMD